ncbi:MAG: histidinol dehydrogenase [Actinomycetota bacterium]
MRTFDLRREPDLPVARPRGGEEPLEMVREILAVVRAGGDRVIRELTDRFDGVWVTEFRVPPEEIEEAAAAAPAPFMAALGEAATRIRAFAERQRLQSWRAEVGGGVIGELVRPVDRAGLYVPGGRAAYPSSVLMCAIAAAVAGGPEVALCTPPGEDGRVPRPTLAAAHLAGVREVYRVGGAQAIAAMAFGAESIPRVEVIVGPGNLYVALAKREVAGMVAIDSVAGPSEIAIVAGEESDPRVVAADLISQAEHGPHGSFLLVTWEEELIGEVEKAMDRILADVEASDDLRAAVQEGCCAILVSGIDQAIEAVNRFAPEHLELLFEGAEAALEGIRHAGAVFVGPYSPVSLGDYLAGTNHVLPTGGAARFASGLRTSHFQKTSGLVVYDRDSLERAVPFLKVLAEAEELPNHARAVEARFQR